MTYQRCYNGVRLVDGASPDNVRRLDYGAIPMVLRMQAKGLLIDKDHYRRFSGYLKSECDRLTEQVHDMTGFYLNLGSPDQIADLLFNPNKLGLKPPPHLKMTKSAKRYTVDDEALSSIKGLHPCIPVIQNFTECHKLKTSYADVLPVIAGPDGRVHTNLRITRQVGGRISSSDPNLMAQPTRSDLGKRIREGFIAPKGRKLGTIDQSQIEMRLAAHIAGCLNMTDTFLRGGDIHVETATRIFFPEWERKLGRMPTKKEATAMGMDDMRHRYPAKRIGFGVLFGITGEGLLDQILIATDPKWTEADRQAFIAEWSVERCDKTIEQWFAAYPEIYASMQEEHAKARRYGYVWDLWGRIRWIPEAKSVHRWIVQAGLRQAYSLRVSSSAQGTMKLAMAQIQDELIDGKYNGKVDPLMQIHDELLSEFDEDIGEEYLADCGRIMERVVRLDVPIKFGTAIGDTWGGLDK